MGVVLATNFMKFLPQSSQGFHFLIVFRKGRKALRSLCFSKNSSFVYLKVRKGFIR